MSYQLSFKASKCTLGSSSAKSVLRCLCDYADDDGTNCRPSTDTISLETEFDRRTVFKAIAFLSSNDWVRVYKNGRGSRNFYAINVQKISNGFEQSRILKEGFYAESSSNFVTSDKNDTSIKNATSCNIKNGTTSGYINDTSNKFDTSNKNDTEVGTFLHSHSDKNDTQLSQYSVNTQSDIYTSKKNDSLKNSESVDDELPLVEVSEVVETAPTSSKPKAEKKPRSTGKATKSKDDVIKPDDVREALWNDFSKQLNARGKPITYSFIGLLRKQAKNAGWTLEEIIEEIVLRGSTYVKAEWLTPKDRTAVWVKAEDYLPELPPVKYATTARDRFDQIMAKSTYAYDIKDLSQLERVVKKEAK